MITKYFKIPVLVVICTLMLNYTPYLYPDENDNKVSFREIEMLKQRTSSLISKMQIIAERIRKDKPYFAEKLDKAIIKIKSYLVLEDFAELKKFLEENKIALALNKTNEIEGELDEVLKFLEDRVVDEDLKTKLDNLQNLSKEILQNREKQQALKKELQDVNKEMNLANEFSKEISSLIKEEEELKNQDVQSTIANKLASLKNLKDKLSQHLKSQENASKEMREMLPDNMKKVPDFIERLDEIISKQQNVNKKGKQYNFDFKEIIYVNKDIDVIKGTIKDLIFEFEKGSSFNKIKAIKILAELNLNIKSILQITSQSFVTEENTPENDLSGKVKSLNDLLAVLKEDIDDETYNIALKRLKIALKHLSDSKEIAKKLISNKQNEKTLCYSLSEEQDSIINEINLLVQDLEVFKKTSPNDSSNFTIDLKSSIEFMINGIEFAKESISSLKILNYSNLMLQQKETLSRLFQAREFLLKALFSLKIKDGDMQIIMNKMKALKENNNDVLDKMNSFMNKNDNMSDENKKKLGKVAKDVSKAGNQLESGEKNAEKQMPIKVAKNQKDAINSTKKAIEKLNQLINKMKKDGLKDMLNKQSKEQDELKNKTREMADDLLKTAKDSLISKKAKDDFFKAFEKVAKASNSMKNASESISKNNNKEAKNAQSKAIDALKEAKKKLDNISPPEEKEKKRRLESLADRQKKLEEKIAELEKKLGKSKENEAAKNVNSAKQNMAKASQSMNKMDEQSAEDEQQKAINDLKRAYQDLEKKIDQLQAYRHEQDLFALKQKIGTILTNQKEIYEKTFELNDNIQAKNGTPDRKEIIKMIKYGEKQGKLVDLSKEIKDKFSEENVQSFEWIMGIVVEDMKLVQKKFEEERNVGEDNMLIQREIINYLNEIYNALKKEINKNAARSNGGGGGAPGKKPLVPPIAELKLLKRMQENMITIFNQFINDNYSKIENNKLSQFEKEIIMRLADDQDRLGEMVEKFKKKLEDMQKQAIGDNK